MRLIKADSRSGTPYVMLSVSKDEAIRLVRTILDQIDDDNPNSNRIEFVTDKGYFSLAVDQDDERAKLRKTISEKNEMIDTLLRTRYDDFTKSESLANSYNSRNKKDR